MKFTFPPLEKNRVPREGEERRTVVVDRLSGKLGKQDANYRPSTSDSKASCTECKYYMQIGDFTSNCRRVAGVVYGSDVCDLFVARAAENAVQPPTQNRGM